MDKWISGICVGLVGLIGPFGFMLCKSQDVTLNPMLVDSLLNRLTTSGDELRLMSDCMLYDETCKSRKADAAHQNTSCKSEYILYKFTTTYSENLYSVLFEIAPDFPSMFRIFKQVGANPVIDYESITKYLEDNDDKDANGDRIEVTYQNDDLIGNDTRSNDRILVECGDNSIRSEFQDSRFKIFTTNYANLQKITGYKVEEVLLTQSWVEHQAKFKEFDLEASSVNLAESETYYLLLSNSGSFSFKNLELNFCREDENDTILDTFKFCSQKGSGYLVSVNSDIDSWCTLRGLDGTVTSRAFLEGGHTVQLPCPANETCWQELGITRLKRQEGNFTIEFLDGSNNHLKSPISVQLK